jgi:hypothetical protein
MTNTLTLLRRQKDLAVDRMEAINALSKKENRDLTEVEQVEWDVKKAEAENLTACIRELETETNFGAPVVATAPAPEPASPEPTELLGLNEYGCSYLVDGAAIARRLGR